MLPGVGGLDTGGVDLFAEAWGDVPGPESEPLPEPQPEPAAGASDFASRQAGPDTGDTAVPKKEQTEAPEPEKPPDPVSQSELPLQEAVPDGDAIDSVAGHAAAAEGSDAAAASVSAQRDTEGSVAAGAIHGSEALAEAAPTADLTELRQQEPLSEASTPPVAAVSTPTPTEEAHQILGAKGKNQAAAMEAAKQKRAAKRAAQAEQPPADAVVKAAAADAVVEGAAADGVVEAAPAADEADLLVV